MPVMMDDPVECRVPHERQESVSRKIQRKEREKKERKKHESSGTIRDPGAGFSLSSVWSREKM